MRLPVLDRYLAREIVAGWAAVTSVLWLILLVNRLVRFLGEAASGALPAGRLLELIGLKAISYLALLVPVGLFLGALLALGRLNQERELVVMAACGAGPARLYRPLMAAALVAALRASSRSRARGTGSCTWSRPRRTAGCARPSPTPRRPRGSSC